MEMGGSNIANVREIVDGLYFGYSEVISGDEEVKGLLEQQNDRSKELDKKLLEKKREIALTAGLRFESKKDLLNRLSELTGTTYSSHGSAELIPRADLEIFAEAYKTHGSELAGPSRDRAVQFYFCGTQDEPGCGYVLGAPINRAVKETIGGSTIRLEESRLCKVCDMKLK